MKKINVGIIGCGRIGSRHAELYSNNAKVKLVGFYDLEKKLAKGLSSKFKTNVFTTEDEIVFNDEIDAVSICTPNSLHYSSLKKAIENNKHVLVEKPIVTTEQHCKKILEISKRSKSKIMVGHTHRFYPCNLKIKHLLDSEKIGKSKIINSFDYIPGKNPGQNMPKWMKQKKLSGGGVLMTDVIHTFDKISWLCHSPITKIYTQYLSDFITKKGIEDVGIITVWLKNGVIANCFHGCPSMGANDMSLKIVGTKGEIDLNFAGGLRVLKKKIQEIDYPYKGNYVLHSNFGFQNEINEFVNSILEKRKPMIDVFDGVLAVRNVLAAYESFKKKRPIIIS